MGALKYGDQIRREDLSDALILADDRNNTLLPRLRKGPQMMASPYAWGVEKSNGRRTAPVPEGIDVYSFEGDAFKKLYNRKQKWWRTPMVTTEGERLRGITGTSQDFKGQKTKKLKEQARDIETTLLSDQDSKEDEGIIDKGEALMALGRAINDGTSIGASGAALTFGDAVTAIPADYRTPTAQIYVGALASFEESTLNDMLRARWDVMGGSPELSMFVGSLLKNRITTNFGRYVPNKSTFTVAFRMSTAVIDNRKLISSGIDIFEGDNGVVDITQCSWMPYTSRGYILDMMDIQTRPLFYCEFEELQYEGAGRKGLIETILGYEYGNPLKHAKIDPAS